VERAYIAHVLASCDGNRSRAAARLGIGRNTLLRKLGGGHHAE
jgi:DNA-binding protein Fis